MKNWQHVCQKSDVMLRWHCITFNCGKMLTLLKAHREQLSARDGASGDNVTPGRRQQWWWWKCHYCYRSIQQGKMSPALCNVQQRHSETCTGQKWNSPQFNNNNKITLKSGCTENNYGLSLQSKHGWFVSLTFHLHVCNYHFNICNEFQHSTISL